MALVLGTPAQASVSGTSISVTLALAPTSGSYLLALGWVDAPSYDATRIATTSDWTLMREMHGDQWVGLALQKIAGASESVIQTPWSQPTSGNLVTTVYPIVGQASVFPYHAGGGSTVMANFSQVANVVSANTGVAGFATAVADNTSSDILHVGSWTQDPNIFFGGALFVFSHTSGIVPGSVTAPRYAWPSAITQTRWTSLVALITP